MRKNWKVRPNSQFNEKVKEIQNSISCDPRILRFLISRGIDTEERIRKFFDYSLADMPSISDYKDGENIKNSLIDAIKNNKRILIYGDYDCDGVTSTSILINTLKDLGCECDYYINNRFTDGFGMCINGIDNAFKDKECDLVITTDNGIDRVDEVEYLKKLGKKVLITDHHLPRPDGIVPGTYCLDAHRLDETAEFKEMCAAGLALMLMLDVYSEVKEMERVRVAKTDLFKNNFILAALGTVCDMMPLIDYNRYIVKEGIKHINEIDRKEVWNVLCDLTNNKVVNETTFGFYFGPLINAIGRMTGIVDDAVALFTSEKRSEVSNIAANLVEVNEERKRLSQEQVQYAKEDIIINKRTDALINVVYGEFYNEGIAGIVASGLKESTGKPSIVLCESKEQKGILKGSARSVDGLHIKELLDKCSDLLDSYGGHAGAAGISLKEENIEEFIKRLDEEIQKVDIPDEEDAYIDFLLLPFNLTNELVGTIEKLAPFGVGFEKPIYCLRGCVTRENTMGNKKDHVKLTLDNNIPCIWWRKANKWEEIKESFKECISNETEYQSVRVFGRPELNTYAGITKPQFIADSVEEWNTDESGVRIYKSGDAFKYEKIR